MPTISVFATEATVPSHASLAAMLASMKIAISFPSGFDPRKDGGFVPVTFQGKDCGFEYSADELDESALQEFEIDRQKLNNRTFHLALITRSSAIDRQAAEAVAAALCVATHGLLSDDGDHPCIEHHAVSTWLAKQEVSPGSASALVRVPAEVVGSTGGSVVKLKLGRVKSGVHLMKKLLDTVHVSHLPPDRRTPNSRVVLVVEDGHKLITVERE